MSEIITSSGIDIIRGKLKSPMPVTFTSVTASSFIVTALKITRRTNLRARNGILTPSSMRINSCICSCPIRSLWRN